MTASAVVLLAAWAALYLLVRTSLLQELDSALVQQAQVMTSVFEWKDGRVDLELGKMIEPQKTAPGDHRYFEVWQEGMGPLARSPSLAKLRLPRPKGVFPSPQLSFAELPNGRPVRLLAVTVRPRWEGGGEGSTQGENRPAPRVTLLLASDLERFETSLTQLAYLLAAVGLAAILATAGGAWWAVGFGLRPMRALARRIEDLGEEDLSRRVELPAAPTELLSVVERLNQLLARLEAAFEREKSLLANLAHELRTPLAGLSFTMEVSLSRPRSPREYMDDMSQCLAISQQMQGMVDNLLTMARLDSSREQSPGACYVDLAEALEQVWAPFEDQALRKGLSVAWEPAQGLSAWADPNGLRVILRNLLSNAVDYSDQGGSLEVSTNSVGGQVKISVANTASRLSSKHTDRIFERFWRGDQSRSGDQAHAGLGLALSRQLAEAMQGNLEACRDAQSRLLITLSLPGTPPPADSAE
ncbi:MAG: sensor histidine kinase N-terminal domain-containing protein [Proteobacteria bacterium]|nr:sensor histidine kinase N-terminal domain-containing protein [Pseudomonadota bacterium]MBU4384759.1 sensor histidine kinase N-terminal domain-containing protein [Pseudomonadota bacterium]MCG2764069.1 ATP-binding protein [Desulfarculaceae bacterium]